MNNEENLDAQESTGAVVRRALTPDEQLKHWVDGKSIHNSIRDECCPDFSCCRPELLADKETRLIFLNATEEIRHLMLIGFLGECLAGKKVYIAGQADQAQA